MFKLPYLVMGHSYLAGDLNKACPVRQLLAALCSRLDVEKLPVHLALLRLQHFESLQLKRPLLINLVRLFPASLLYISSSWTLVQLE